MKRLLPVFLILTAANADAELSKWVDEQGKVHYSDRPPVGVEATPVRAAPPPAIEPAPPKSYIEREAELRKAQQSEAEKAQEATRRQSSAEIEKANCNAAQQTVRSLQQDGRIVEYDEAGERRFLGDDERQQRIAEAQAEIEKWCK
jgi:multidrug efflux pump subunit AcrA (membrane-fusion protein)